MSGREVKVGIMDSDGDVLEYAVYNEFGTSRGIPPRPFMSTTYDRYHKETEKFIEFMYNDLIEGKMNADKLLRTAGEQYQKRIQQTIREAKDWAAPNAPETVARKGSSSPLIDTGRMIGTVRYEVK